MERLFKTNLLMPGFFLWRRISPILSADRRGGTRKRRSLYRFETIHTLRYVCLQRAGLLLRPDGYATLDVGGAPAVADRFKRLDRQLKAA